MAQKGGVGGSILGFLEEGIDSASRPVQRALPPIERKGAMPGDSKECILFQPQGPVVVMCRFGKRPG